MNLFSSITKRRGATLAGIFSVALGSVVLLCGAGSVPVENLLPQGAMQGDLNAGGFSVTNAATVSATNFVLNGAAPNTANGLAQLDGSGDITISGTLTANTVSAANYSGLPSYPSSPTWSDLPRSGYYSNNYTVQPGYYIVYPVSATAIVNLDPAPYDGEMIVLSDALMEWGVVGGAYGVEVSYGSNILIDGPDYSVTPCTTSGTILTYVYNQNNFGWCCYAQPGAF